MCMYVTDCSVKKISETSCDYAFLSNTMHFPVHHTTHYTTPLPLLLYYSQVRLQVLQSLVPEFDRYLARTQHVSTLLLLLADEVSV